MLPECRHASISVSGDSAAPVSLKMGMALVTHPAVAVECPGGGDGSTPPHLSAAFPRASSVTDIS